MPRRVGDIPNDLGYVLAYECNHLFTNHAHALRYRTISAKIPNWRQRCLGLEYDLAGFLGQAVGEEVTISKLNGFRYREFVV